MLLALFLGLGTAAGSVAAESQEQIGGVPVKVVNVITRDTRGNPLGFPSQVFFDPSMAETYVLAGGKLNVYGAAFYPEISLGPGRDATSPQGGFVDPNGILYLCQGASEGKPARLSIFNAAFFLVREIFFSGFEGADKFSPNRVAVNQDGMIYLVSPNVRGVVVLDRQGKFSHWLKPTDRVYAKEAIEEALRTQGKKKTPAEEDEYGPVEGLHADIPPELMPKTKEEKADVEQYGIAPVLISDLSIDSEGHLYVLSAETGKVYVYTPGEELLFSFGEKGGAPGKMSQPRGLAIDEKRKSVFVVDYMRHTVLIYDLAGKFINEFGGLGTAAGWFYFPCDVALDKNDNLMVADLFNKRVQVLDVLFKPRFPMFGEKDQYGADSQAAAPQAGPPPMLRPASPAGAGGGAGVPREPALVGEKPSPPAGGEVKKAPAAASQDEAEGDEEPLSTPSTEMNPAGVPR